ncbi:MAG: patatin-like phospholipase family protein [Lachnospira sp.]|jgi:NTE family protein|nr:patatin-like phospholipase family protein [Lachnospira sp.]
MQGFGLVLSGGGAKGAYQVGAFRALKEYDITISGVSGTSIGGINGFAYATMSVEVINKLWDDFTFEDFITPDNNWFDGISDRSGLRGILEEYVYVSRLKSAIPIFNTICEDEKVPEYRLLNNKSKEEAIDIMLATSALPVIYSKVSINDKKYMDGGLADNLPVAPLYDNGFRKLLIIGLSAKQRIDKVQYPAKELIEIYPSKDLGNTLSGTINFSPQYIQFAKNLGYEDAKRILAQQLK